MLISSKESKARQTLEPTGQVFTDIRFNEVARDEPYDGDFRARRRAYLTGTDLTTRTLDRVASKQLFQVR